MNVAPANATPATAGEVDPALSRPPGPPTRRLCRYCMAPLGNGAAYCGEACEDGAWSITPTVDGEV